MARALIVAVGAALFLALPAGAAAPRYILVTGPTIARPILLDDWGENGALLATLSARALPGPESPAR